MTFNGQGTVSGQLAAIQQALAINPAAIITPADADALQKPIKDAVAHGIPVIGIHATAFPGPAPELGLFMNIASNPAEIGQSEAAYVIASSNGTAKDIHMVDSSYAIARFKAKATIEPIKNCSGCKFLEEANVLIGESCPYTLGRFRPTGAARRQLVDDDLLRRLLPICGGCPALVGQLADKIRLVGADGPPSSYDMIRKGGFEVATVPEPSTLFGYEAVDAAIRAFAGEPPAEFVQPTYLVAKDNVDAEGGKTDQFIPSNNFPAATRTSRSAKTSPADDEPALRTRGADELQPCNGRRTVVGTPEPEPVLGSTV